MERRSAHVELSDMMRWIPWHGVGGVKEARTYHQMLVGIDGPEQMRL